MTLRIPFSVFDELVSECDSRETPATIHTEYRYEGVLHEERLRGAVAAAVSMHPMAQARKVAPRVWLRPPQWEIGPIDMTGVVGSVHCADERELVGIRDTFYSTPIDLAAAPALRLLIVHRPGGDSLLVSVNHGISDGLGTLRFVYSVARAYAGRPDPLPAVDPLAARALKVELGREVSPQSRNAGRPRNPRGTSTFVSHEDATGEPGYGIVHVAVPATQVRRLHPRRFGPSATMNDLLLGALHLAIARWNETHHQPADVIVVLMPLNLRPLAWYNEVVGNMTSSGRIVSTPAQRATAETLMATVLDRTEWLKRAGGGMARLFQLPSWLYGLMPVVLMGFSRLFGGHLRLASVLTYLGRMDGYLPDFGPEVGRAIEAWGSPPLILPGGIGFGAGILGGRLFLSFRYCRAVFNETAARRFVDLLLETLTDLGTSERPNDKAAAQTSANSTSAIA